MNEKLKCKHCGNENSFYTKAKGKKGTRFIISEWTWVDYEWHRTDVQVVYVDGINVKEDIFYKLENSKCVEVCESED